MQNPSRRLFFGGRTPTLSAWEQCLLQLQHKTQGKLRNLGLGSEQAVFTVNAIADLHHARQLCHAFGVSLYLWGVPYEVAEVFGPILWLDVSALNQLEPVDEANEQWFMQAGVSMRQLKAVGFEGVDALPEDLTVAVWLANAQLQHYPLRQIEESGLEHASLLQADGSVSSLGAFGVQNTKPLNTVFLRQLIPQLFQLCASEAAQELLSQPYWLGRYRLDILDSQRNPAPNLAHLLLGHGGDFGLLEWVVMNKNKRKPPPVLVPHKSTEPLLQISAQELDAAIKALFDADDLFSSALTSHEYAANVVPQHV